MTNPNEALARAKPLTAELGPAASSAYRRTCLDDTASVGSTAAKHAAKLSEWPGAVKETFGRVYDPRGMRPIGPDRRSSWGEHFASVLEQQAAWGELREAGQAHREIAARATTNLTSAIANHLRLDQLPDEPENGSPEEIQRVIDTLERMKPSGSDAEWDKSLQQLRDQLTMSKARRDATNAALDKAAHDGSLGKLVQNIATQAQQDASALGTLRGCGFGIDPTNGTDPVDLDMLHMVQAPELAKILELVGRMQRATKQRVPDADGKGRQTPCGLTLGSDVRDMVLTEWALEEEAPDLFLRRFLDGQATLVEREGREPRERGDMICLVDRSGSMSGQRMVWARALAFTAVMLAYKDNRRSLLGLYNTRLESCLAPAKDPQALKRAMQLLKKSATGGTDTADAIRTACANMTGLKEPDILLITDGQWPELDQTTKDLLKISKARLYVVLLEGAASIAGAERVWSIPSLNTDTAASILQEVSL